MYVMSKEYGCVVRKVCVHRDFYSEIGEKIYNIN